MNIPAYQAFAFRRSEFKNKYKFKKIRSFIEKHTDRFTRKGNGIFRAIKLFEKPKEFYPRPAEMASSRNFFSIVARLLDQNVIDLYSVQKDALNFRTDNNITDKECA